MELHYPLIVVAGDEELQHQFAAEDDEREIKPGGHGAVEERAKRVLEPAARGRTIACSPVSILSRHHHFKASKSTPSSNGAQRRSAVTYYYYYYCAKYC